MFAFSRRRGAQRRGNRKRAKHACGGRPQGRVGRQISMDCPRSGVAQEQTLESQPGRKSAEFNRNIRIGDASYLVQSATYR